MVQTVYPLKKGSDGGSWAADVKQAWRQSTLLMRSFKKMFQTNEFLLWKHTSVVDG